MAEKYNGWTNYETWNVALWLDNEQGSYDHWREVAQECWNESDGASQVASGIWTREEAATFALADMLKEEFEEGKNNLLEESKMQCSVWADLLGAALSEVDWNEIAEHYIEEVDKEAEEAEAE